MDTAVLELLTRIAGQPTYAEAHEDFVSGYTEGDLFDEQEFYDEQAAYAVGTLDSLVAAARAIIGSKEPEAVQA